MGTVTKRELNQRTADVLAEVTTGEPVTVTERGVPRWRIEAFDPAADPVAQLEAQGRISPRKSDPAPWPSNGEHGYTHADIDRLLADTRGDI